MYIINLAVFGVLASQAVAVPLSASHVVHERREYVPDAWVKRDRLDAAATLPVRIGMTQRNLENGYDMLLDV
jgi:tripeptidyl-peptidase-1